MCSCNLVLGLCECFYSLFIEFYFIDIVYKHIAHIKWKWLPNVIQYTHGIYCEIYVYTLQFDSSNWSFLPLSTTPTAFVRRFICGAKNNWQYFYAINSIVQMLTKKHTHTHSQDIDVNKYARIIHLPLFIIDQ